VGGGAGIAKGVVEDEVFEMDEFAVDPQRGTGIGEILPLEKAGADGRAGNALVETGECDAGVAFTLRFQTAKRHMAVRVSAQN